MKKSQMLYFIDDSMQKGFFKIKFNASKQTESEYREIEKDNDRLTPGYTGSMSIALVASLDYSHLINFIVPVCYFQWKALKR